MGPIVEDFAVISALLVKIQSVSIKTKSSGRRVLPVGNPENLTSYGCGVDAAPGAELAFGIRVAELVSRGLAHVKIEDNIRPVAGWAWGRGRQSLSTANGGLKFLPKYLSNSGS